VGLVSGVSFAEHGNDVTCVDIDPTKVRQMQKGIPPIHEEGLQELMQRNSKAGRLHFTTDLRAGIDGALAIFLALPTPESEDGSADLQHILDVADQLGALLKDYTVIVNKSTVPTGTADLVHKHVARGAKVPFDVVSNPEFLREGQAVEDVRRPDRIVIGTSSKRARAVMAELYEPYVRNGNPIRYMSEVSAELTKYASNGFLATKISFINELAHLAETTGADIMDVRLAMGDDPRIGRQFLHPSLGWGGSCFPKDSRALIHIAERAGLEFKIMEAADQANDRQKKLLGSKIKRFYKDDLKGKRFALWGLAFKKDTDDIRESPALEVLDELLAAGADIVAYDPAAMPNVRRRYGKHKQLHLATNQYEALQDADALIIATDWEIFTNIDLVRSKKLLAHPVIFDGRLLLNPDLLNRHGFYYETIGRPTTTPKA
jgi:UDPglucose 6-dehydrogenase